MSFPNKDRCDYCKDATEHPVMDKGGPWVCCECKKTVSEKIHSHNTGAILCSLECEKSYWLYLFN